MAKLVLDDVGNLANANAAAARINDNFDRIEAALEKTLSRDGTSPNQMEANLDMNSRRILNLPAPVNLSEPARLADVRGASSFPFMVGNALVDVPITLPYSASMTPAASDGNWFVISPNNNVNFTLNPPTATVLNRGQRITITIKNDTGQGLGTATWVNTTPGFRMGAAWVQPANGYSRSIDFRYDGANWIEVGRTPVDVNMVAPPPPPVGLFAPTDDFQRADENPLGGNWRSQSLGYWGNAFISSGDLIADALGGPAYWVSAQPQADQWAAMVPNGAFTHGGVALRLIPNVGTMYLMAVSASNTILIYRWNAGAPTGLQTITLPFTLTSFVDEVMMDCVTVDTNTVRLSVYVNNVYVGGVDDTSADRILTPGYVGANARAAGGCASWRAGNVADATQGFTVLGSYHFDPRAGTGTTGSFVIPPHCDAVAAFWSDWEGAVDGNTMATLSLSVDGSLLPAKQEVAKSGGNSNIGVALKVAPTYGSQTLSWAHSSNTVKGDGGASLFFLRGVKQSDPYRNTQIVQTSGATDCQAVVTSAAGDYVLGWVADYAANADLSGQQFYMPFGGSYSKYVDAGGTRRLSASKQTASGASTTVTMTGESFPDMVAVSFKPA